jgi:hypothetical protein
VNAKRHFELIALVLLIAIFAKWQLQPKSAKQTTGQPEKT